jgi:tRNA (cmo5U34)-methyltransferase
VDHQFHFDPATYLDTVRREVPGYDTLQSEVSRRVGAITAPAPLRVLDLGTGTGSTSLAVLAARPDARLVLLDENPGMLAIAREVLPAANVEREIVGDLADPLPAGPFDLVVSALAIHHLDPAAKQVLFGRVHAALTGGGRFVVADVVVPDDPADAVAPLSPGYDKPDRAVDLLRWLDDAGFAAERVWAVRDLAVFDACPRDDGRQSSRRSSAR